MVTRYINIPVPISMSRKDFLAHPDRDRIKDGAWLSPVSYDYETHGRRGNAYAKQLVLIFLDLDDAGPIAKDILADPKSIIEALWPYNVAAWTTAKHTPEAPRLRIVVPSNPCDPSFLPRFVAMLADRLGLPADFKGRVESSTVSQPAYRPTSWAGEPFDSVLVARTDGLHADVADLPDEEDPVFGDLDAPRYGDPDADGSDLGLLSVPVQGITLDDVRDALKHVDPDCSRREWLEVCAALKHQFHQDEDAARQAYDLFVEWSERGTKFRGENDTYRMWKSLKPYPVKRLPVTVRTVFKMAREGGWNNIALATRLTTDVRSWIAECDDVDALMGEAPRRIAAMPVQNDMVESALISQLQKRVKELGGDAVERRSIAREIAKERRRESAAKQEERLKEEMPGWLRPFAYVSCDNKFYNFGRGKFLGPEAFNLTHGRDMMPEDGAEQPANGKPVISPVDYALHIVQIPVVYEVMYCPLYSGEDPFFEWEGHTYLNLYNPLSVPVADPEWSEEAGRLFFEHGLILTGDPYLANLLCDYCAASVQFPGRKIRWAFCIQSAEGVGKNMLGEIMRGVLGKVNAGVVSSAVLKSEWNDWWPVRMFQILNEVHFPGEQRERIMNGLKPLVTDDVITINKRNTSADVMRPNFTNCIAFTNHRDALHLKGTNRRWCVVFSPLQREDEVRRLRESGHFDRLAVLAGERAGALRYWLLKRQIAADFPWHGPPPQTKHTQAVIEESKNELQVAIEDALESGNPYFGQDIVSVNHLHASLPSPLLRRAAKVTHYLALLGFERAERAYINGDRATIWVNPDNYDPMFGAPAEIIRQRLELRGDISL